jgi:hypothetical protein
MTTPRERVYTHLKVTNDDEARRIMIDALIQEGRVYSQNLTFNKPKVEGRNYAIWLKPFSWTSFKPDGDVYGDTEMEALINLMDLFLIWHQQMQKAGIR